MDFKDGRVVKGVKFLGLRDVSSPGALAKLYNDEGADELAFYDITASSEGREIFADVLGEVTGCISIPLTVGGGISTLDDFARVIDYGADKVSINSGALKNPELISKAARKYGSRCVVLSADIKRVGDVFHVFANGGMDDTGLDAIEWIKRAESMGAGELVINSIDTDGVQSGYDLSLLEAVCNAVSIPVIASGGAGSIADFVELFEKLPKIDAGLAASVFHFGMVSIPELKRTLHERGISVRLPGQA